MSRTRSRSRERRGRRSRRGLRWRRGCSGGEWTGGSAGERPPAGPAGTPRCTPTANCRHLSPGPGTPSCTPASRHAPAILVSRALGEGCSPQPRWGGPTRKRPSQRGARACSSGEGMWGAKGTIADELVLVTLVNMTRADGLVARLVVTVAGVWDDGRAGMVNGCCIAPRRSLRRRGRHPLRGRRGQAAETPSTST